MSGTGEALPAARFLPGQVLAGRYRAIERVGKGGMGEVYRADDLKLGQEVALKFLPHALGDDPQRLSELFAEVRMARQISHPNVCRVHDIEEVDGTHALSMEFVDGEDLGSLMRRIGRLPADKASQIVQEICAGLAAIHDRGVLHRDLKPANIMLDGRGHARITDFGLAGFPGRSSEAGVIAGTPAYMSPESFDGVDATSVRSDLYSLGLVMYELFTGRAAFEPGTIQDVIHARRESRVVPPTRHVPDLDPRIERAILRCLEPAPARRPRSAGEVAAGLPGGDRVAAMIAAGETPSPELVAAATGEDEGFRPAVAWTLLISLAAGLIAVTALSPRTRIVPRLPLTEPPQAMAGQASLLLREVGVPGPPRDRAFGYEHDVVPVDRIVSNDRSPSRWDALSGPHAGVVSFWYRESSSEIAPEGPRFRVSYTSPPLASGESAVKLDPSGRLIRFEAPAAASHPSSALEPRLDALLAAAGLDPESLQPATPRGTPPASGDQWLAFAATRRGSGEAAGVDVVSLRGQPVAFVVRDARAPETAEAPDPSRMATHLVLHSLRPALMLVALVAGAWLARRNLRARRADLKRALRLASGMMLLGVAAWALAAHHTIGSITWQLTTTFAWGLYDFAFGWIFYVAIEPYVRRLWPRLLTAWSRLLDGKLSDARVGREILVGCVAGVAISLLVAGHREAPALFGAPPGRPDNVGYVENQLASLLGPRAQLAELITSLRSNVQLAMGFVVILVLARFTLRHPAAAIGATLALFVPLGLARGDLTILNLALPLVAGSILLFTLFRFGLVAAALAMCIHALLQAAPLGLGLGTWATDATVIPLTVVLGLGLYGFARSLGGRPAFRDPVPTD